MAEPTLDPPTHPEPGVKAIDGAKLNELAAELNYQLGAALADQSALQTRLSEVTRKVENLRGGMTMLQAQARMLGAKITIQPSE